MNKVDIKDWVASLEAMIDKKLAKWDKHRRWENGGDPIHFMWQWEHVIIKLDVFVMECQQGIRLRYIGPCIYEDQVLHGLTKKTFRQAEHYAAHWDILTMHPPIDPEFP